MAKMLLTKNAQLENLREAVEKQAANLDPAQREFVMVELGTFEWNAKKIHEIECKIDSGDVYDEDGMKAEAALVKERHQIVTEQASLFSHIMRWLKGTNVEGSELDEFMP